jgi:hypothetical protein
MSIGACRVVQKDGRDRRHDFLYLHGCFCHRDQVFLDQNYLE